MTQVDGEKYVGRGKNKKMARTQAAEEALQKLNKSKDCAVSTDIKLALATDIELAQTLAKAIFK